MPFIIYVKDKPGSVEVRNRIRLAHLEYLEANQDKLLAAGALLDDDGTAAQGGAVILDVEDRADAEAFVANDPFTQADFFETVDIIRWRKSFFDRQKLI